VDWSWWLLISKIMEINDVKMTFFAKIIAGLLQLGNVDFSLASEEAQPCDLEGHSEGVVFLLFC